MLYAYSQSKEKIEATPNALGFCPSCGDKLIPRCGQFKIWHWAHKGQRDCDDWYEPETEWHLSWKKLFGRENCEVVMPPHRADIYGNFNVVIELQHSNISPVEIRQREEFYKKMIWIVDAHPFAENLHFFKNRKKRIEKDRKIHWSSQGAVWWADEYMLLWERRQKRWLVDGGALMPVMLDLSNLELKVSYASIISKKEDWLTEPYETVKNSLFWIKSLYESGIGGRFVSKQRILERYKPSK